MNKQVFRDMSYGVYITTSYADGRAAGCITNSNTQITSSPATFSVSVNHANATRDAILKSGMFAFTVLAQDSDPTLIGHFGFSSSRDVHKFMDLDVPVRWVNGVPAVMTGCGYVVCRVVGTMETSTHTIFLGEALEAEAIPAAEPMTYRYYHQVLRGKSPKNAPTFDAGEAKTQQAVPKQETSAGKRFVCTVCGYVYEGESLPADFICPICKHGAQDFEEMK